MLFDFSICLSLSLSEDLHNDAREKYDTFDIITQSREALKSK